MSKKGDEAPLVRHPRETVSLYGHQDAEATLLEAYRGGQCPHAWLIGGPHGIGKATLAFRFARFVLAQPIPSAASVQNASSLAIDANQPSARHIAAGTHGGLLVLERTLNDRGVLRTEISVEDARATISFFGSTSADDGWRVCVVDTVDELNANSANALLKVLEEPPARAMFLLVSNAPARVLPTIQSRCRKLLLRPLEEGEVVRAVADATDTSPDDKALKEVAGRAEGSVARALMLLGGEALGLQHRTEALLQACRSSIPKVCTGSAIRWPATTAPPCWRSSTHWSAGWAHSSKPAGQGRICPALRVCPRCGRRSAAPCARPRNSTWNANRWFFRCSECLLRPCADRSAFVRPPQFPAIPTIWSKAMTTEKTVACAPYCLPSATSPPSVMQLMGMRMPMRRTTDHLRTH